MCLSCLCMKLKRLTFLIKEHEQYLHELFLIDAYSVLKNTHLQTCLFFVYFVQHFSLMWHRHTRAFISSTL